MLVSSIPSDKIPGFKIFGFDKIVHIIVFFIFGILIYRSLQFSRGNVYPFKKIVFYTLTIAALYGTLSEVYQGFIPGRSTDIFDFLADLIGVIIALFYIRYFHYSRGKVEI